MVNTKNKQKLIQQGAEAKILLNEKKGVVVKDRISKSYRISEIDKKIRKTRTKAETKLLQKASEIINSPKPLSTPDKNLFQIKMPYIKGKKLSEHLNNFPLEKQKQIMKLAGESVAKLHKKDIIHGDLTTSNMILVEETSNINKKNKDDSLLINSKQTSRHEMSANVPKKGWEGGNSLNPNDTKIFFIDFGLGFISKKIEDKAVDLHLLKQALEAKHFKHWETLFKEFSKAYEKTLGKTDSKKVFERITAVERRGRYRH